MPFETLRKDFVLQITSCNEVLVVASPFYDPICIKRAWCLFEAVMAKIHQIPTIVVTPPTEVQSLQDRIMEPGGHDILSSKAVAKVDEDLRNIQKLINDQVEGGFKAVDNIFKNIFRE